MEFFFSSFKFAACIAVDEGLADAIKFDIDASIFRLFNITDTYS